MNRFSIPSAVGLLVSVQAHALAQEADRGVPSFTSIDAPVYDRSRPGVLIPFNIGGFDGCLHGQRFAITLRVKDREMESIAIPVRLPAKDSSAIGAQAIDGLQLPCGRYAAYWADPYGALLTAPDYRYYIDLDVSHQVEVSRRYEVP